MNSIARGQKDVFDHFNKNFTIVFAATGVKIERARLFMTDFEVY
jgi:vacuolar-type H+-ATPase subunit B/Vma2